MHKQTEGKIVKILDEYRVVINKGSRDGVAANTSFVIFSVSAEEINDPETGENLGQLELVKGYVNAIHIQDRVTICTSVKMKGKEDNKTETTTQTLSGAMMAECMAKGEIDDTEKLDVNISQVSGIPQRGTISIGDSVRSL